MSWRKRSTDSFGFALRSIFSMRPSESITNVVRAVLVYFLHKGGAKFRRSIANPEFHRQHSRRRFEPAKLLFFEQKD